MIRRIILALALCGAIGGFALYDVSFGWGFGGGGGGGGGGWPRPPGGGGGRAPGGGRNNPPDPGRRPGNPNNPGKDVPKEGEVLKGEKYNKEFDFSHEEKDGIDHHRQGVYSVFMAR
jgi:hypothetical protein